MAMTFATNINPSSATGQSLGGSSRKWKINGHVAEMIAVQFVCAAGSTSTTVSNADITSSHICVTSNAATSHSNFASNIVFSTSAGSVTATYTLRTSGSVTFWGYFVSM